MEEIKFSKGKTEISFFRNSFMNHYADLKATQEFISFSVPRQGEFVSVRSKTDDFIEGRVQSVRWYYSDANTGPVILVHVDESC